MSKRSKSGIDSLASLALPLVLISLAVSGCSSMTAVEPAAEAKATPAKVEPVAATPVAKVAPKAASDGAMTVGAVPKATNTNAPKPVAVDASAASDKPMMATTPASAPTPVSSPAVASTPAEPASKTVAVAKKNPSVDEFKNLPPNTFVIHSVDKDATHPFFNKGSKLGFSVNGVQGNALVVERGKTYTFNVDTNIQHDFYLATKPVGRGGFTLAKGVKGNFLYEGELTFTADSSTPDTVYYACRNHAYMGGPIFVTNNAAKFDLAKAVASWKAGLAIGSGARKGGKRVVSESQAKQKVSFAAMYIRQSAAARRIEAGTIAKAKSMLKGARQDLDKAEAAMTAKDYARAVDLADAAMKLMSDAGRLAPAEDVADNSVARTQYKELRDGILTYRKSYKGHLKRMTKAGSDMKEVPKVDLAAVDASIERAQKLAEGEDYDQASRILNAAQTELTTALTAMLKSATLSYELKFDEPKDEYEYEVSRFNSYAELIPIAIEQKHPSKSMQGLMQSSVNRGNDIAEQAKPVAAKGDYKTAIQMMQGATSHIQRALRMLGIR